MSLYDDVQAQRRPLVRQLAIESDRGCAIVGSSLLEEDLEMLLRDRMRAHTPSQHIDTLFSGYGPLSSFAAKTAIAYAMGLIDNQMFQDLEVIRRIRNRFAHEYGNKEFFDQRTFRDLCAIRCTYPVGTPDYDGATIEELRSVVREFSPSDGQEPKDIQMSGGKAKFLMSVLVLSQRITLLRERETKP